MLIFTILLLIAIALTAITIMAISAGGVAFILVFGDVIICIFLILWVMKRLIKRRNK